MRRVLIAGTGRAGTTLLVQLLHELGFDTGADDLAYCDAAQAGLETRLTEPDAPQVVKDPTIDLNALFATGWIRPDRIERVLLPVRSLRDAARSRLRRSAAEVEIDADGGVAGTLWRPWAQRRILAEREHRLVEAAAQHEIPVTIIHYPRLARDPGYAYRRLAVVTGDVDRDEFDRVWHQVVQPGFVQSDLPPLSIPERLRLGLAVLHTSVRRLAVRLVHWIRRHR